MGVFKNLPNIGIEVEKQLHDSGIHTVEELKAIGSKQAWLNIQKMDPSACIHRLYSLEGAIRNIKKKDLPYDIKEDLKSFYRTHKL